MQDFKPYADPSTMTNEQLRGTCRQIISYLETIQKEMDRRDIELDENEEAEE